MTNKVDYTELALAVVADECRKSFFYFVKTFWDVVIKEEPVYNWHIPYLCKELQDLSVSIVARQPKPYDLIINIPPGTTKSTIVTIMWPVWLWTQDPSLRIITNSYSGGLSIDHATKSKDIIQSDKFRTLFPKIKIRGDKSGKQNYENTDTGYRYATSTGATITGFHAHVIINDDPVNPKQAESDQMRLAANEHTKTLSSRKVNKENTPVVTIMQRLHDDDVTGYLLKKKGENIRHICLPAEDSDNVKPAELRKYYVDGLLDPKRLNRRVLEEAKTDLGSRGYAGQYEQKPSVEGGNIVKEQWFRKITLTDFNALRYHEPIHFFLDTAYDEKKKKSDNDPSGIIAACKIKNNIFIVHAQKVWKDFPALIKFLPDYMAAHDFDPAESTLRIEPKANGKSVCQQLEQESSLNVTYTPSPSDSKEVRLHSVSPKIECGRVYLVEGEWNEEFIDEVCGFPQKTHDEYVDVLGYCINYFMDDSFVVPEHVGDMFGF
jgi:predicted phage terminase large subunit-like protein